MSEQRRSEGMVTLTVQVPLMTYRFIQQRAEEHRVSPSVIATHQLKVANDPGNRKAAQYNLRMEIYEMWRRGMSGPKIARELGIALSTVNKHKRAIRDNFSEYAREDNAS